VGEIVTAARVSDANGVVDHALYWVGFDSEEEAQYVASVINTRGSKAASSTRSARPRSGAAISIAPPSTAVAAVRPVLRRGYRTSPSWCFAVQDCE
jgi:hypothetical protein